MGRKFALILSYIFGSYFPYKIRILENFVTNVLLTDYYNVELKQNIWYKMGRPDHLWPPLLFYFPMLFLMVHNRKINRRIDKRAVPAERRWPTPPNGGIFYILLNDLVAIL